jgi:polar amino acid transport system substrate-binding protein
MNVFRSTSLFIILFFAQLSFAQSVVRITAGEWSPYISNDLDSKGLIVQIATEAFAQKGVTLKLGIFPWARATELSKSGEWDGTLAFAKLKERQKFYLFSDPVYIGRYVLFHLKVVPLSWNNYQDLKKVKMASTRGFGGMGDEFLKAERDGVIQVERFTSDVQSFQMLLSKRVQAVPSDLEVGYILLRRLYGEDSTKLFTHAAKAIQESPYHLVISKKTKNGEKIIETFNEGLKQLHASGRYQEIIKSWYARPLFKEAIPVTPEKK